MAQIQVGIIAKRNMETGEFGPAMPIYKEIDESVPMDPVLAAERKAFERMLAKKMGAYFMKTRKK